MAAATTFGAVAVGGAMTGCAAPRDPELEKKVWRARFEAEKGPPEAPPAPAPAPTTEASAKVSGVEIKTYSSADVAKILGAVPGTGTSVMAAFDTDAGTITCELDSQAAPQAVANFVALATGQVEWKASSTAPPSTAPFYDGLSFYRVVAEYLIEGGKPQGGIGPGWRIARERGGDNLFEQAGAIAMLADGNGMNGSRFFILARPDKALAQKYSAFGVCNEIDLVKRMSIVPQAAKDTPQTAAVIQKVRVYRAD